MKEKTKDMKEKIASTVRGEKRKGTIYKARDALEILGPLLKERRTSYERWRRLGRAEQPEGDVLPAPVRDRRQIGPRQQIYSPPEMRLQEKLKLRETRLHPRLRQLIQGNSTVSVLSCFAKDVFAT